MKKVSAFWKRFIYVHNKIETAYHPISDSSTIKFHFCSYIFNLPKCRKLNLKVTIPIFIRAKNVQRCSQDTNVTYIVATVLKM